MKVDEEHVGNGISVILILFGCVILFTTEMVWLGIVAAWLIIIGLWGLIQ